MSESTTPDRSGAGEPATPQRRPEFTVTETAPDQFLFYQRVVLRQPIEKVWAEVRDGRRLVGLVLPEAKDTFAWLDGGNAEKVPSRFEISVGGAALREEITFRDDDHHALRYRLTEPGLGMQTYQAELKLTRAAEGTTSFVYARNITLQPGFSVEVLKQVVEKEIADVQAFFAR
ncbi:SRPBCC family protein [Chondromyces apiculatus]|uniref:Uncharacterized protein n=1 Tax=Chondromyces apiculatus DSM 436 TaxID=1192034 RepID=A0A017T5T6_9BACT|nr:SRPBCC family protein [Chondromyces apiculatus]EYF04160.1 Hypothetical protein CAP_4843 [Chondromyces apiculatus DSM 436]